MRLREGKHDTGCFGNGLEVHLPDGVREHYICCAPFCVADQVPWLDYRRSPDLE